MHPLRAYRQQKKLTGKQAAVLLNCSKSFISRVELRDLPVSPETAYAWEQRTKGELRADKLNPLIEKIRKEHCCQQRGENHGKQSVNN